MDIYVQGRLKASTARELGHEYDILTFSLMYMKELSSIRQKFIMSQLLAWCYLHYVFVFVQIRNVCVIFTLHTKQIMIQPQDKMLVKSLVTLAYFRMLSWYMTPFNSNKICDAYVKYLHTIAGDASQIVEHWLNTNVSTTSVQD